MKLRVTKRDYWLGGGLLLFVACLLVVSARNSEATTEEVPIDDVVVVAEAKEEPAPQPVRTGSNTTTYDPALLMAEKILELFPILIGFVVVTSMLQVFFRKNRLLKSIRRKK